MILKLHVKNGFLIHFYHSHTSNLGFKLMVVAYINENSLQTC